jgi:hypothetical protein
MSFSLIYTFPMLYVCQHMETFFIFEKHVTICQYDYLFITNIVHPKLKTMGLQEKVFFFLLMIF